MKVLFLDIDGVLNGVEYQITATEEPPIIDKSRLPILKEIIDKSNATVVLSSSWKKAWAPDCPFDKIFKDSGITISDTTPVLGRKKEEITAWLNEHPKTESFVILDDADEGWGELKPFVAVTNPIDERGLETKHITQVLNMLNKNLA